MKRGLCVLTILIVGMMLLPKATAQVTIGGGLGSSANGADLAIGEYVTFGTQLEGKAAPVGRTGQTICYGIAIGTTTPCAGTGQDGDWRDRVGSVWPDPRFTDNSDGTVTDHLTGLIWLKNANCFDSGSTRTWLEALSDCNDLASGACGLSDGSAAGDWRLPNRFELESLLDLEYSGPALSNASGTDKWTDGDAFTGVQGYYWSSSTCAADTDVAWDVDMSSSVVDSNDKADYDYVWPVRGGQ
ncbi:MAG: DUF1566 domain-containing protein [Desulfobacterales bacterium]|nr:DUF1566 domain-containing protein [Desulfobacterales bacterium]